jgi:hypothetical protein
MRAWLYIQSGQAMGLFLELRGQRGPEIQKAFRMETPARTSFHVEALWLELRSNRFAPDFAPLRCAQPGSIPHDSDKPIFSDPLEEQHRNQSARTHGLASPRLPGKAQQKV